MEKQQLVNLINQGMSISEIALYHNCSKTNTRYWLKKFNLITKSRYWKKNKDYNLTFKCACGEIEPDKFYGNKKSICSKCHNKQNTKKGKENRDFMIKYLGGKCMSCGFQKYSCSLDIHHTDPKEKDVAFGTIRYWKKERIVDELKKCVLLCKNCHQAFHNGHNIQY